MIYKNPPDIEYALKQTKSKNKLESDCGTSYLIAKFRPLIHKLAFRINNTGEIQDLIQSGNIGIIKAIQSYNYTSSFMTYVFSKIRHELQIYTQHSRPIKVSRFQIKNGAKNPTIYENATDLRSYDDDPKDYLIEQEDSTQVAIALRTINRQFNKLECKIFIEYYFLDIPLIRLSKKYHINANAIVRKMILALRENINK